MLVDIVAAHTSVAARLRLEARSNLVPPAAVAHENFGDEWSL
jgi:hypothetical protein